MSGDRDVTPVKELASNASLWLRSHPVAAVLLVVGGLLAGSALNAWIDGIWGYVAYGAGLLLSVVAVQLYLRRGGQS